MVKPGARKCVSSYSPSSPQNLTTLTRLLQWYSTPPFPTPPTPQPTLSVSLSPPLPRSRLLHFSLPSPILLKSRCAAYPHQPGLLRRRGCASGHVPICGAACPRRASAADWGTSRVCPGPRLASQPARIPKEAAGGCPRRPSRIHRRCEDCSSSAFVLPVIDVCPPLCFPRGGDGTGQGDASSPLRDMFAASVGAVSVPSLGPAFLLSTAQPAR